MSCRMELRCRTGVVPVSDFFNLRLKVILILRKKHRLVTKTSKMGTGGYCPKFVGDEVTSRWASTPYVVPYCQIRTLPTGATPVLR